MHAFDDISKERMTSISNMEVAYRTWRVTVTITQLFLSGKAVNYLYL